MNTAEKKIKDSKQLQIKILRRFMSEEDILKLTTDYTNNSRTSQIEYRADRLGLPLTPIEKKVLRLYFLEKENNNSIMKENGLKTYATLWTTINGACRKIIYQNRDLLKLAELLK